MKEKWRLWSKENVTEKKREGMRSRDEKEDMRMRRGDVAR